MIAGSTPQSAATVPPARPWWKRRSGVAAIAVGVFLGLAALGSAMGPREDAGAGQSPAASAAVVGATASPTPLAFAEEATTEPTPIEEAPSEEPEATPAPPPPAKPASYAKLTDRQWAKVVKTPDSYTGKTYQLWACITQFDAATGTDTFRAQASNTKQEYWYSDGENVLFNGDEDRLADFVEDDIVFMKVTSLGAFDYDTQIGGNTTAPLFMIDSISHKGSCAD
jgi:hypothetical protein